MSTVNNISSSGNTRIVGQRLHLRDDELVGIYLRQKLLGRDSLSNIITLPEVNNLYDMEPWELPYLPWPPEFDHDDQIWYFYHRRDPNKKQHKRVTEQGFWSVTGNPKKIKDRRSKKEIGFKRTMTFYYKDRGYVKKKKENKTAWVMHENHLTADLPNQNTIVLYTLKYKEYEIADISSIDVQQPGLPCNLETCITEDGGIEDEVRVDDYGISSVDFDGNQQITIGDNGGSNFPISGMNSPDSAVPSRKRPRNEESGLNIDTENEEILAQNAIVFCKSTNEECKTADISSNEDQQSLNIQLPCNSEKITLESGSPKIQDWIETEELQEEPAAFNQVDDPIWNQLICDDFDINPRNNQQNMVVENGACFTSPFDAISSHFTQSPTRNCCFDAETEGI